MNIKQNNFIFKHDFIQGKFHKANHKTIQSYKFIYNFFVVADF